MPLRGTIAQRVTLVRKARFKRSPAGRALAARAVDAYQNGALPLIQQAQNPRRMRAVRKFAKEAARRGFEVADIRRLAERVIRAASPSKSVAAMRGGLIVKPEKPIKPVFE